MHSFLCCRSTYLVFVVKKENRSYNIYTSCILFNILLLLWLRNYSIIMRNMIFVISRHLFKGSDIQHK